MNIDPRTIRLAPEAIPDAPDDYTEDMRIAITNALAPTFAYLALSTPAERHAWFISFDQDGDQ